jgi:hypothetical protein
MIRPCVLYRVYRLFLFGFFSLTFSVDNDTTIVHHAGNFGRKRAATNPGHQVPSCSSNWLGRGVVEMSPESH